MGQEVLEWDRTQREFDFLFYLTRQVSLKKISGRDKVQS